MRNDGITRSLMVERPILPDCTEGLHDWYEVSFPSNGASGYHTDRCSKCGLTVEYDTSD